MGNEHPRRLREDTSGVCDRKLSQSLSWPKRKTGCGEGQRLCNSPEFSRQGLKEEESGWLEGT